MDKTKLIAAVGAVLLTSAALTGGVMATAPTLDTETTDTTTTTQIDGTYTQTYNETTASQLNYSQDTNQTEVTVFQGSATTGRELATYDNTSDVLYHDATASSTYYWTAEFDDDASDYTGIEADAGESVTITAQAADLGDTSTTYTNTTYTFTAGTNTSFVNFNDSETETAEAGTLARISTVSLGNLTGQSDVVGAAQVDQDIGVNGEDQDKIVVNIANADAQNAVAEVYDSSEDADGVSYMATAQVNGELVPVMAEGADAPDWIDSSQDAYVVVSEDGQTATVENAGDVMDQGDTTASVDITANEKMGFMQAVDLYEDADRDAGTLTAITEAGFDINGQPSFEAVEA